MSNPSALMSLAPAARKRLLEEVEAKNQQWKLLCMALVYHFGEGNKVVKLPEESSSLMMTKYGTGAGGIASVILPDGALELRLLDSYELYVANKKENNLPPKSGEPV